MYIILRDFTRFSNIPPALQNVGCFSSNGCGSKIRARVKPYQPQRTIRPSSSFLWV